MTTSKSAYLSLAAHVVKGDVMVKLIAVVLAGALATLSLSGCTGKGEDSAAESGE